MTLTDRLAALATLGERLQNLDTEPLNAVIRRTALHNSWLTEANQRAAITAIRDAFLQNKKLEKLLLEKFSKVDFEKDLMGGAIMVAAYK